jgi:hypothetical protein
MSAVTALLADGRRIPVLVTNMGWEEDVGSYVTMFEFDGVVRRSHFCTHFHTQMLCPAPAVRLETDLDYLRDCLQIRFGALVNDIEA